MAYATCAPSNCRRWGHGSRLRRFSRACIGWLKARPGVFQFATPCVIIKLSAKIGLPSSLHVPTAPSKGFPRGPAANKRLGPAAPYLAGGIIGKRGEFLGVV